MASANSFTADEVVREALVSHKVSGEISRFHLAHAEVRSCNILDKYGNFE